MVVSPLTYAALPLNDHVVRFAASNRLHIDDDTGEVLGLAAQAFALRDIDEGKLSVTWCEYFPGRAFERFHQAVQALRNTVRPNCVGGAYGIAQVENIVSVFRARTPPVSVRVVHAPSMKNQGHATINNYRDEDSTLLDLLATSVFNVFVLDDLVPP